jgi:hypothetical protein
MGPANSSLTKHPVAVLHGSSTDVAKLLGLPAHFQSLVDAPKNFLPEAIPFYSAIVYIRQKLDWDDPTQRNVSLADSFLNSGFYLDFSRQLAEQEPANVEHAAEVVRLIVSTTTLQKNISVENLMEVLMEIIAEESPSGLALNLTRKSIRNEMVFAPSPKEFRDSLLRLITSLARLVEEIEKLHLSRDKVARNLEESPT